MPPEQLAEKTPSFSVFELKKRVFARDMLEIS